MNPKIDDVLIGLSKIFFSLLVMLSFVSIKQKVKLVSSEEDLILTVCLSERPNEQEKFSKLLQSTKKLN